METGTDIVYLPLFQRIFFFLKFISLRATLCTEPVLGQVMVDAKKKNDGSLLFLNVFRPLSCTSLPEYQRRRREFFFQLTFLHPPVRATVGEVRYSIEIDVGGE